MVVPPLPPVLGCTPAHGVGHPSLSRRQARLRNVPFLYPLPRYLPWSPCFRVLRGRLLVGLVAIHLWRVPGVPTCRGCSDFDRSLLAASGSLEFPASQVVTALGDLVRSRHDSLLDSVLSKMRALPPTHLYPSPAKASSENFD